MPNAKELKATKPVFKIGLLAVLAIMFISAAPVRADFDFLYFSVNGDTTLTTMTQGDEFGWGTNCELGATINWEIWYDANSNSTIDKTIDFMLTSENITDGNLMFEESSTPDGAFAFGPIKLTLEPGDYILRVTDINTDSSLQAIIAMTAMASPPNQFTGQIIVPGITAPNSLLANRAVFAESDTGDEGFFGVFTDNMGQYSMNLGAEATGVTLYLEASAISGYVPPDYLSVVASGVVSGNDLTYFVATDSVWGYVKDETGAILNHETGVSANSDQFDKYASTINGRYVIYFTDAEKGDWRMESDSKNSPTYVSPVSFDFSHDTLGSFQHDIILTRTDDTIFAVITENGGFPTSNYRVDASHDGGGYWAESVSGTGSDNIAKIAVTSLAPSNWYVNLANYDDEFPIPDGLIATDFFDNVSPGDTVEIDLINGLLVSGTITQDPEDAPVDWSNVYVGSGVYGGNPEPSGNYAIYVDTGLQFMSVYSDNYISNPSWREITINADTSGVDFTINESHCTVSGTLTGVTLPLDASYYGVTARTATDGYDGYYIYGQVDSATGTYSMNLSDGDWTLDPPCCFSGGEAPGSVNLTIGESPDNARTVDFDYTAFICGDVNGSGGVNILDMTYIISYLYLSGPAPDPLESGDVNNSGGINILDMTYLINYLYVSGPAPNCP